MGSAWPSRVVLEPSPGRVGWLLRPVWWRGIAVWGSSAGHSSRGSSGRWLLCFPARAPESRYVGFGNTVPPPKKEDDFLNSAMSSLYSVSSPCECARREGAPAQAAGAGPSLSLTTSCVCHSDPRSPHSLTLTANIHFKLTRCISSKERTFHVDLTGRLSRAALVGPHAAFLASVVKMRFGGRVSKLGMALSHAWSLPA